MGLKVIWRNYIQGNVHSWEIMFKVCEMYENPYIFKDADDTASFLNSLKSESPNHFSNPGPP